MENIANGEIGYITGNGLQNGSPYYGEFGTWFMFDLCTNSFSILCVADCVSELGLNLVFELCAALRYLFWFQTSTKSSGAVVSETTTRLFLLQSLTTFQNSWLSNSSYFFTSLLYLMGYLLYAEAASDEALMLVDFGTEVTTVNGTFTVTWHGDGIMTIDYTP